MSIVIFTGAGAGKADGAPLQTELFQKFFSRKARSGPRADLANDVAGFFESVFGVDPRVSSAAALPTFEEALGVLELALAREETILGVASAGRERSLQHLKRQLILALAATIARSSPSAPSHHSRLVANLREASFLTRVTFVTTNYDTLLDDGIETEALTDPRGIGSLVDYGFNDLVSRDDGTFVERRVFKCYKIHGSLNWLFCSACDDLHITYASDGVTRLIDEPDAAVCPTCETPLTPVIVPPSYYKDMSSVHLAVVWNRAFVALRDADHVIFCGYSFPDADIHVKYLVKRAQLNRDQDARPLRVTLVNHYTGKTSELTAEERLRFSRFLGDTDLSDSGLSFEQFAVDPIPVISAT